MLLKGNHMVDPLVKVPLIVKWPRQRGAGQVSERLVSNVDLAPTLCLAAGLQPAAEMHGENLGGESQGREIVFCESGPNRGMARTRTHKLLFTGNAPQQTLFYDLQSDPLESRNLSGFPEAQDEIRRLTAAIATWRPQPVSQRYVDLQAPQIRGANVPSPATITKHIFSSGYKHKIAPDLFKNMKVHGVVKGVHRYGGEITPQWVIVYFDRKEVARFPTMEEWKTPLYMLVDMVITKPEEEAVFPMDLTVKNVSAYLPAQPYQGQ